MIEDEQDIVKIIDEYLQEGEIKFSEDKWEVMARTSPNKAATIVVPKFPSDFSAIVAAIAGFNVPCVKKPHEWEENRNAGYNNDSHFIRMCGLVLLAGLHISKNSIPIDIGTSNYTENINYFHSQENRNKFMQMVPENASITTWAAWVNKQVCNYGNGNWDYSKKTLIKISSQWFYHLHWILDRAMSELDIHVSSPISNNGFIQWIRVDSAGRIHREFTHSADLNRTFNTICGLIYVNINFQAPTININSKLTDINRTPSYDLYFGIDGTKPFKFGFGIQKKPLLSKRSEENAKNKQIYTVESAIEFFNAQNSRPAPHIVHLIKKLFNIQDQHNNKFNILDKDGEKKDYVAMSLSGLQAVMHLLVFSKTLNILVENVISNVKAIVNSFASMVNVWILMLNIAGYIGYRINTPFPYKDTDPERLLNS